MSEGLTWNGMSSAHLIDDGRSPAARLYSPSSLGSWLLALGWCVTVSSLGCQFKNDHAQAVNSNAIHVRIRARLLTAKPLLSGGFYGIFLLSPPKLPLSRSCPTVLFSAA
jgi:hypothetical protein